MIDRMRFPLLIDDATMPATREADDVLLAMSEASDQDRNRMTKWMENGRDFDEILEMIQRYNGVERALDEARRFADRATDALASLKPVDAQSYEFLNLLPAYVLGRAY